MYNDRTECVIEWPIVVSVNGLFVMLSIAIITNEVFMFWSLS